MSLRVSSVDCSRMALTLCCSLSGVASGGAGGVAGGGGGGVMLCSTVRCCTSAAPSRHLQLHLMYFAPPLCVRSLVYRLSTALKSMKVFMSVYLSIYLPDLACESQTYDLYLSTGQLPCCLNFDLAVSPLRVTSEIWIHSYCASSSRTYSLRVSTPTTVPMRWPDSS